MNDHIVEFQTQTIEEVTKELNYHFMEFLQTHMPHGGKSEQFGKLKIHIPTYCLKANRRQFSKKYQAEQDLFKKK